MFSFLQVHKHIMLKPQGSLISSTSTEFSIESLLVVYNINIMQQAGYIYANLPTLCAGCMDFTDYSVYHSFCLISPANMSSLSAFIISPIWPAAYFFYGLFYLKCKIVVKCNI